ncbi:UDP-glycosyltransferase UGT5-like [Cloeon dipterum]|uniref:UDP-glycosyltransferase UGT5-like n=1 Tax=Cloeon dipterum TaxID=197152 RepID=UPI00321F92E6
MRITTVLLPVLATIIAPVQNARILGVFPFPGRSHMITFSALTEALAERGHELVVVSTYPSKNPPGNYTDINTYPDLKEMYNEIMNNDQIYNFEDIPTFLLPHVFYWTEGTRAVKLTFKNKDVKRLLKDDRGFDLVISEDFACDAVFAFSYYLKAPLILISSFGGFHWQNYAFGNPYNPSYAVNNILEYGAKKNFQQRLMNTLFTWYWDIASEIFYYPAQERLKEEFFGPGLPSLKELRKSASLGFVNNHFSLSYPRPLVPAIVEVGGMHVKAPKENLPENFKKWLDEAKDGAIYFSLGSNLRAELMPESMRKALLDAFAQLPQRVLWKYESEELPGKPDNVMISPWVPQMEVLAHPNVKLFITHGGLLSGQEAMYNGLPVVGIPVFGDQKMNVQRSVDLGYGVMLSLKNITKESVLKAINKGLHCPKIRAEIKRRQRVFLDQPESPLERAVFWTEYVIRHEGAAHLRSAALDLSWYQLELLDVYGFLIAVFLATCYVFIVILKFFCRMCSRKQENKTKEKQKKN